MEVDDPGAIKPLSDEDKEYIQQCQQECAAWKKLAKRFKKETASSGATSKKKSDPITYESVKHHISEEDKQFLAGRCHPKATLTAAKMLQTESNIATMNNMEAALVGESVINMIDGFTKQVTKRIIDSNQ